MSSPAKTEAIVVWDIENNRVPLQLVPRCFEIVQWLLQDVQESCPNSTVLRVYVAGTFDKYPTQLKNALCTHPRVQLLYSIGKIAKGGEADDALKRVVLDFHTTQLVAQKQALIVLLSGDADYNDVVDAARVAGHKVHLYHSHAVAHTLRGNVDHHEAWQDFLARKSGRYVEDLDDTGYVVRGASPASTSAGTLVMHRRVPHSHPGVKPITIQAIPNRCHCTPTHQQRLTTPGQPASDTDSAMQAPSNQGRTLPLTRSGTFVKGQPLQNDSREQPSQAPQDSGDSDPSRPPRRRPRGSTRQPNLSLSGAAQSLSAGGHGAGHSPSTSATSSAYQGIPDGANPASDGRTVVVSGIRKGMPGPEARQGVMELCAQHGEVTACWLRKGKSSSWFGIAQFAEAAAAHAAVSQCSGSSSQNGSLSMRWYLAEAPSGASLQMHNSPGLHVRRSGGQDRTDRTCAAAMSHTDQEACSQQCRHHHIAGHDLRREIGERNAAVNSATPVHCERGAVSWSNGTRIRITVSCALLCTYFVMLTLGC